MEDEDVLQLLTGEDEFDADIDEVAEEELLRDDVVTETNRSHSNYSQNQNNVLINKSMDDEEEEDDRDSARRGRFRSERIMSLASVPTRRREIPDSLDSITVKLDKSSDKNNYNYRRNNNNNQQKYRNFPQNSSNGSPNQRHSFRGNQGLLPLPNQSIGQTSQHQQRMILIPPVYSQQMPNNSNPMNTIHVNPHFRARMTNQFEQMNPGSRPQPSEQQLRLSTNIMIPSRLHYPNQTINNSQQMLFNPQINNQFRPHFMSNNQLFGDQSHPQMGAPLQPSQQPLLHHPQQTHQPHHQMQMESQWRAAPNMSNMSAFQMPSNLGQSQQIIGQQMPLNRPINVNPMMGGPTQPNFNPTYEPFPSYQSNQQFMPPSGVQPSFQPQNNFGHHFQPIENQRFPIHQNFNKMGFGSQQQNFQSIPNQQMIPNNITVNQMKQSNQSSPQKPSNVTKRPNSNFESTVRPYKQLIGANDQQKSEAIKAAQMRTKRAKQLLTKKQLNVVKEVQIIRNPMASNTSSHNQNKEIEAAVGVDEEYKKKLEEQKRLREEILRTKEERRKAMAAQRLKETEIKSSLQTNKSVDQKPSPVRSQPQQQIATLLNRSPQPTSGTSKPLPFRRVVKPITNEKLNTSKPQINRLVVVNNNQNQKRSVLIKGLAASTTELALRKLCKPIGAIESCKICLIGGQKTATVTFVRSQDAIQFQSKYERTLLDLSIIQVSLIWFVSHYFSEECPKSRVFLIITKSNSPLYLGFNCSSYKSICTFLVIAWSCFSVITRVVKGLNFAKFRPTTDDLFKHYSNSMLGDTLLRVRAQYNIEMK